MTQTDPLSGVPFEVNRFKCYEMARRLTDYVPPKETFLWSNEPLEGQLVFKILFVSVCHQFNWDFMQSALARHLLPNPHERLEEFLNFDKTTFDKILADYPKRERWRSAERAKYLRTTARELIANSDSLKECVTGQMLEGPNGFYRMMERFFAFREDQLKKKSRVLAHDLFRERIVRFDDVENLKPAVEYHLIRLYLRTGRVYPTHPNVRRDLLQQADVHRARLVKVLRQTVSEAMELTSFYAGLDAATLNYVEWQIARNVCDADTPTCARANLNDMPGDVSALFHGTCLFAEACEAYNDKQYGMYKEPQFQKAIY